MKDVYAFKPAENAGLKIKIGTDNRGKLKVDILEPSTGKKLQHICSIQLNIKAGEVATCQIEFYPSDIEVDLEEVRWQQVLEDLEKSSKGEIGDVS